MMKRPAPHSSERTPLVHPGKETPGPIQIAAVWTGSHECRLDSIFRNPFSEAAKLRRVLLGGEVSAATPRLVPDSPVTNLERISITARRTHIRKRRRPRR